MDQFLHSDTFSYVVLPFLIFFSRICDVTLGTLRIIFVSKGNKLVAPILGFFEVLIWILVISRIMQNLDNFVNYLAYAGGFATGNLIGLILEEKLAMGILGIRIITRHDASELINFLNDKGFGATSIEAMGSKEKVHYIFTIVKRTDIDEVLEIIKKYNPNAFYSIEDVRFVNQGVFPTKKALASRNTSQSFRRWRKGL